MSGRDELMKDMTKNDSIVVMNLQIISCFGKGYGWDLAGAVIQPIYDTTKYYKKYLVGIKLHQSTSSTFFQKFSWKQNNEVFVP